MADDTPTAGRIYDSISREIEATGGGRWIRFTNLGYCSLPDAPDGARLRVPRRQPLADMAQLVAETLGGVELEDRELLDVGCGRGGALNLVARSGEARRIVGVDVSTETVRSAVRHGIDGCSAAVADSEALPFADASFDVVLNVESAFHYPRLDVFFGEVRRVLRDGGRCCICDLLPTSADQPLADLVEESGFELAVRRDVSDNVQAALERHLERADTARFPTRHDGIDVDDFARLRDFHDGLQSGRYLYRIMHLDRTPSRPAVRAETLAALETARAPMAPA